MNYSSRWILRFLLMVTVAGIASSAFLAAKNRRLASEILSLKDRPAPVSPTSLQMEPKPETIATIEPVPEVLPVSPRDGNPTVSSRLSLMKLTIHGDLGARLKQLRDMGTRISFDDFLSMYSELSSPWREQALGLLILDWSPEERFRAMAWAGSLESGNPRDIAIQALANAAQQDSETILNWLLGLPESQGKTQALLTAIRQIARSNPFRAAQLIDTLGKAQPALQAMTLDVLNQWLTKDIPAASAWAGRLPPGPMRDQAYGQVARVLAATSPEAALDWCKAIETDRMREWTTAEVVAQWANKDQAGAAKFLTTLPAGPAFDMAVMRFAGSMAAKAPQDAIRWVETMENSDMKRGAMHMILGQWINQDAAAAGAWASQMPAGPDRDTAFQVIARQVNRTDPKAARAWAEGIQSDTTREHTLRDLNRLPRDGWRGGERNFHGNVTR